MHPHSTFSLHGQAQVLRSVKILRGGDVLSLRKLEALARN